MAGIPLATLTVAVLLLSPGLAQGQTLSVSSLAPPAQSLGVSAATPVRVTFDVPLHRSSLSGTMRVFGRWSGVAVGTVSLEDGDQSLLFRPSRPFFPGEPVTVTLSSDVLAQNGSQLRGGYTFSFWIRSAPGSGDFVLDEIISTKLPGEPQVQTYGSYAGDLDRDGAPDLSMPCERSDDVRVMLNDGCGDYGPIAMTSVPPLSKPSANEGDDFNGDGVIDLATCNFLSDSVSVLLGDGAGGYLPATTYPVGDVPRGVTAVDAEGDGDLDLVIANRGSSELCLMRNNGDGTFAAAEFFEGGGLEETTVLSADANGDGLGDLFVAHFGSDTVSLLLGNALGGWVLSDSEGVGVLPWNAAVGDVDGDGHVDMVTVNAGSANASIVRGDGAGGLLPAVNIPVGGFPTAVDLGDLDGDGDLDLVSSNVGGGGDWTVYFNNGAGVFGDMFELDAVNTGSCAVLVDYDRDGLLDIVTIDEVADELRLWQHVEAPTPGVQTGTCGATLRIDNLGHGAGFGGKPAHRLTTGETFFVGLTGEPGRIWGLLGGFSLAPGIATDWGLFNIDPNAQWVYNWLGVIDAQGEAVLPVEVPAAAPVGFDITFQGMVLTTNGLQLSNPEVLQVTS